MKKKEKKTREQVIEASLSKNRTTVRVEFLQDKTGISKGEYKWVSEDNAILFVENGLAKISDKDYEARLIKSEREMPKAKRKAKAKAEPVTE